MRVVLTGCAVRERDRGGLARRFPAVDLFLRPDEEPELVERLGLASAQAPVGRRVGGDGGHDPREGRPRLGGRPPRGFPRRSRRGRARAPHARRHRLAADHLRLRQDLHVLHRPVQPRSRAEPALRRDPRRGAGHRRGRLPRGHAPRPERQQLRPRPAARGALRPRRRGAPGRPPARAGRAPRPRGAHPGDRRDPRRRRAARDPAPAVRDLASVGPLGPARSRRWPLPVGLRGAPSPGPVRRRRRAPPHGPPVHGRALRGAAGPHPRGRAGDRDQHRRHRRILRRDRRPVRGDARPPARRSATTRSSRRPTRRAPGRRPRDSRTTCRRP